MGDSNFQKFFEVLEEVEALDCPPKQHEKRLETIPEKWCTFSSSPVSDKMLPIWDIKTVNAGCKVRKYSLRRPGFIYRSKDLSRTAYLDNNLWEFTTCGKRILKSPSFKYRQKRKSVISPYSTKVFENFGRLSLEAKGAMAVLSSSKEVPEIPPQHKESTLSEIQFLPLKKSLIHNTSNAAPCIAKKKRVKPLISPAKLGRTVTTKPAKNSVRKLEPKRDKSNLFSLAGTEENSSFGNLCCQIEPLTVRKYASSSFDNFRNVTSSGHSLKASGDVLNACNDQNDHSDTDEGKFEPSSEPPKRMVPGIERSCSFQARMCEQDISMSVDEMSIYMEDILFLPQKMSKMAEMMYT